MRLFVCPECNATRKGGATTDHMRCHSHGEPVVMDEYMLVSQHREHIAEKDRHMAMISADLRAAREQLANRTRQLRQGR